MKNRPGASVLVKTGGYTDRGETVTLSRHSRSQCLNVSMTLKIEAIRIYEIVVF